MTQPPHTPAIVGLTGYARSGKDTAAAILGAEFGFVRFAFADRLRELAVSEGHDIRLPDGRRLSQAIAELGWEGVKSDPVAAIPARVHLQELGVALRESYGADFWVDQVARLIGATGCARAAISDVRFANEARWVLANGGIVIRLVRPGVGPANGHVSERPIPNSLVTAEVRNDGPLAVLAARLRTTVCAAWPVHAAA